MANGATQVEDAIEEAKADLRERGYLGADPQSVILAGFGYLATEIRNSRVVYLRLDGKFAFTAAAVIGAALGALTRLIG